MEALSKPTVAEDYGSAKRVNSGRRILAEQAKREAAGKPLNEMERYLAGLIRREAVFASLARPT